MRQRALKLVVVRLMVALLVQLCVAALPPPSDGGPAKRVLVLLHDLALSSTHSLLLHTLAAGGRDGDDAHQGVAVDVDVRAAGAAGVRLHEHGVWKYDALVLLGSELGSELGGEVEVREQAQLYPAQLLAP
jgi:hypothetical protein